MAVTDPDTGTANGVKYGKVVSVDFTKGDRKWYVWKVMILVIRCQCLGVGKLQDPQDTTDKSESAGEKRS